MLTLPSLPTPTAPHRTFSGPVHGWVSTVRKRPQAPAGPASRTQSQLLWPSQWAGDPSEGWMECVRGALNWEQHKQPATNWPLRVPRTSVWAESATCARAWASDSRLTGLRATWFPSQDHPRAEYEARVLEKSLRRESKSKEVRRPLPWLPQRENTCGHRQCRREPASTVWSSAV